MEMRFARLRCFLVAALVVLLAPVATAFAQRADIDLGEELPDGSELLDLSDARYAGDLAEIRRRGMLRVLVAPTRTDFQLVRGEVRGFEAELAHEFARFLNRGRKRGQPQIRVLFVPLAFEDLIPGLLAGRGDVIASGMTVTPTRGTQIAFSRPYLRNIDEVIVARKDWDAPRAVEDLAGRRLSVRVATSYFEHLQALNRRFAAEGLAPIEIVPLDPVLADEDKLEMVSSGIFDMTVVDSHLAALWTRVLPNIAATNVKIAQGGAIAWGFRPEDKALRGAADAFFSRRQKSKPPNDAQLLSQYFQSVRSLANPLAGDERAKLARLSSYFRAHADTHGFDWMLMAAQGFQESRLDQQARSAVGAIGIMQLMAPTAAEIGFPDVGEEETNVAAGIAYMARIRDRYFADPEIEPSQRILFAIAAYNAGPNRIQRLRVRARAQGLDPNLWFGNVERIVQQSVGDETVTYVANIYRFFHAYATFTEPLLGQR
jgi:membrane-bound lytic murein transglycosylase MltF